MSPLAQSNKAVRPPGARQSSLSSGKAASGFSLVELLLVVGLLLLFASAMVFNFSGLLRGNQLEEGTTRLETLMRFARAQAANSGHKVQLVFNSESTNTPAASTGEVRATWEPDPLRQPGCFADLTEAQWHLREVNDMLQVESVKLLDASAHDPAANACPEDDEEDLAGTGSSKPIAPITFYPDGSSDSAEIIVATRSSEEDHRMSVRLVGITGSISHQLLTADLEEPAPELSATDRSTNLRRDGFVRDSSSDRESSRLLNSRALASSTHPTPMAARATVGETNIVDRGE
jgi:type II secretory pathway pseudopilin PulG